VLGYCDSQARKVFAPPQRWGTGWQSAVFTPGEAGRSDLKAYIEALKRMRPGRLRDGAIDGTLALPSTRGAALSTDALD
jgi:DNA-binding transcriptional regulator PaaX